MLSSSLAAKLQCSRADLRRASAANTAEHEDVDDPLDSSGHCPPGWWPRALALRLRGLVARRRATRGSAALAVHGSPRLEIRLEPLAIGPSLRPAAPSVYNALGIGACLAGDGVAGFAAGSACCVLR